MSQQVMPGRLVPGPGPMLLWPTASGGYLGAPASRESWLSGAVARCRKADPTFPMVTAHPLRHTAASLAISAGANPKVVQRMLGHVSAAMTLDVYADLFDSDLTSVAESVGKMWHGGSTLPWATIVSDIPQRRGGIRSNVKLRRWSAAPTRLRCHVVQCELVTGNALGESSVKSRVRGASWRGTADQSFRRTNLNTLLRTPRNAYQAVHTDTKISTTNIGSQLLLW
jgi:hypothetical protein